MKVRLWAHRLSVVFVALAIIPWVVYWCCGVQIAALVVYYLTLVAVAWYTNEAHLLRLQHIRPYVVLIRDGGSYRLLNVGNGAALNVHVANAKTRAGTCDLPWDLPPILKAGDEKEQFPLGTLPADRDPAANGIVDPNGFFEATISYEDVEGTGYTTCMLFKPDGNRLAGRVKCSKRA